MATNSQMTPRQRMINMLYLVLTAILALNVSNEVLDAFKTVNDGIDLSNNSQKQSNEALYSKLNKQYDIDPKRAQQAYEKSQQARALSKQLNDLLEKYKQQMISEAGGIDKETGKIKRDDDINVPTHIMVENNAVNGKELKKQIIDTRTKLLALLNEADRKSIEKSLALKIDEPKGEVTWEHAKFNSVPVVAAVTLLSKYQSDVLAAEGHIVEKLYSNINGEDVETVDQMEAKVISPSSYILQGEPYNADVMVAASSSTLVPEVFIGSFTSAVKRRGKNSFEVIESASDVLPLSNPVKVTTEDQMGKLALSGSSIGNKKYTGVIRVKSSGTGNYKFYPFEGEYQVAQKSAVVSPVMMNVLYIGLENPLNISVPGVAQSDVSASISAGSLKRKPDGNYTADVKQPGTIKVVVKAKVNNKEMVMGEQQFRVKRIPDPVSTLDGVYSTGKISVSKMKSTRGVVPQLKDFVYDTRFTVVSYDFVYRSKKDATVTPPQAVNGPLFSSNVKTLINRVAAGDAVFIDNIIVRGPDGTNRKINAIAFDITP